MIINIVPATREELYEVAGFLDDCWHREYARIVDPGDLDAMTVAQRHQGLLARFDSGESSFLVVRGEGQIIGAAVFGKSFTEGYPEDGEISAIYLRGDCIGKGYGHALFTRVEEVLAAKGYAYLVLDVLTGNTRAIGFYRAHGYQKVADGQVRLGSRDYPLTVFRKAASGRGATAP